MGSEWGGSISAWTERHFDLNVWLSLHVIVHISKEHKTIRPILTSYITLNQSVSAN